MSEDKGGSRNSWIQTDKETIVVTGRESELVHKGLRLPENYFTPGIKVLSVGEGLSDFSSKLRQKGVDIIAVDPIYAMGGELLHEDPSEVQQALQDRFSGKVFYDSRFSNARDKVPLPDPEVMIAGSVYQLPFVDNSFDCVLSYRLFEHVDLAKAIPELLRVVKDTGEIRMGGVSLTAIPSDHLFVAGSLGYEGKGGYFYGENPLGFEQVLQWLSQQPNLSLFGIVKGAFHRSEIINYLKAFVFDPIIIRKGNSLPTIAPYTDEERNLNIAGKQVFYPEIGKIYKIDFTKTSRFKNGPNLDLASYGMAEV